MRNKKKIIEVVNAPNAADAESQVVRKRDKLIDIERLRGVSEYESSFGAPKTK